MKRLDDICAKLAAAAQPDTDQQAQERQIRERIRKLDQELDSYRAIVRTEPEAASTVGKWIAETNQERRRLEAQLGGTSTTKLAAEDIKALVASLQDITGALAAADPADKAKVYAEMGIDITYHQDGRVVIESLPRPSHPTSFCEAETRKEPAAGGFPVSEKRSGRGLHRRRRW